MKLRNKKTGEIIETDFDLSISIPDDEKLYGCDTYTQLKGYTSLAELNEEWEDYEEPKEYWFIRDDGSGVGYSPIGNSTVAKRRREIGNYFETKEEAEANGYIVDYDNEKLVKLDEEKLAHEAGLKEKNIIVSELEMLINDTPYQVYKDTLRKVVEFLKGVKHE